MRKYEDVSIFICVCAFHDSVQRCRDDQGSSRNDHEGGHGRGYYVVEFLLVISDAAGKETAAEDEKDVGEDGAEHG